MRMEPLFIRVVNRNAGSLEIIQSFLAVSDDEPSKKIAADTLSSIPDISMFVKDFREMLEDIADNGISQKVINYLNSYMKPSLSEVSDSSGNNRTSERRWVYLKDKESPWVEAIVCYNLSLYIKAYGMGSIKKCSTCNKFFTHKGKYAKYCSDTCKGNKGND